MAWVILDVIKLKFMVRLDPTFMLVKFMHIQVGFPFEVLGTAWMITFKYAAGQLKIYLMLLEATVIIKLRSAVFASDQRIPVSPLYVRPAGSSGFKGLNTVGTLPPINVLAGGVLLGATICLFELKDLVTIPEVE